MRTLCLLLLCSMVLFKANGQAGSLDPNFGNKGIQTTAFNIGNFLNEQGKVVLTNGNGDIFVVLLINSSVTIVAKYLPDGRLDSTYGKAGYSSRVNLGIASAVFQGDKIVVAGSGNGNFALTRYTADGALDSSFGVNGIVEGPEGGANAIALQGDKIIAAGNSGGDFALTRYTADGILDSSFGVNGLETTDFNGGSDGVNAIALQGDKLIVAGNTSNAVNFTSDFALARYTADGILDASFGVHGKVTTDFKGNNDFANAIVLQGDKIIVGGSASFIDESFQLFTDFALARYTADGKLDASFGVNGKVTTDFNGFEDLANAIVLQGNKIIAAGYAPNNNTSNDFALARYTADGILDSSFGVNGKVITDFNNSNDQANAIVLQGDKILAAGSSNGDYALARFIADGTPDSSFGVNGKLTGYFPSTTTYFTGTVVQGNKIIAAGYALNDTTGNDFALARYMADGSLDSSFGVHGKVTTDFNNSNEQANAIALQGDKIVVAGYTGTPGLGAFALARYTADGILDSTFGVNGKVITVYGANCCSDNIVNAIALQGGKIIVGGYSYSFPYINSNSFDNITANDFVLARYTVDGRLDSTFGGGGNNTAVALAIQGDKIIVAGNSLLARYTANGILDSSFGVNGAVAIRFNGNHDVANAIALQGNNIIVAGSTTDTVNNNSDFALARYTKDGVLDASFGVNGLVTTDFNDSNDNATSVAVQEDKIIVGGYTDNSPYRDFALTGYTADGTLDSSFGVNGKVITDAGGSASLNAITLHENRLYAVGSLNPVGTYNTYGVVATYQLEAPEPSISIADVTVCESQKYAVLNVQLSAPSSQVIRMYYQTHYITAYTPQDYIGGGAILYIAAGTTMATIKIPIVNDSICEPTEQFEVLLRNACHATLQDSIAIVTIKDDDCSLITTQAGISSMQQQAQTSTSLTITASPNPSADAFTIQLHSSDLKQQVSIRVYDIRGRLLEQREHISIGQVLHLGDHYKPGTYIIEALQGNRSVQTKVIKTGQ